MPVRKDFYENSDQDGGRQYITDSTVIYCQHRQPSTVNRRQPNNIRVLGSFRCCTKKNFIRVFGPN